MENGGIRHGGRQAMFWKQDIHQIMNSIDITTEDAHYKGRWRAIICGRRNLLYF